MREKRMLVFAYDVLVNICSTGRAEEILAGLPHKCAILDFYLQKPLVLWDITSGNEVMSDGQHMLVHLVECKALEILKINRREHIKTYQFFGRWVREELADLFTLANIYSSGVVLDDPIIRRRISKVANHLPFHSTLDILHRWQKAMNVSNHDMLSVLQSMAQRASFFPDANDPLFPWWNAIWLQREDGQNYAD